VGVGYTVQGKVPGRSSMSFHLEAARNAIADAGAVANGMANYVLRTYTARSF
jgi:hypothetical protein